MFDVYCKMQFSRDGFSIAFLYHIGRCKAAGQADAGAVSAGSGRSWTYLFTVAADGSNLWRVPVRSPGTLGPSGATGFDSSF